MSQAAEAKAREERVRERVRAIKQIKDAEAGNDTTAKAAEKVAWEKKVEEDTREAEETRRRSLAERFVLVKYQRRVFPLSCFGLVLSVV